MINLPKSTLFNKRIPKQKFYENLDISPGLKKVFVEEIKTIYWRNKISEETVNIQSGEDVEEIQVFLINLNQKSLNEKVLMQIDAMIPYHILFVLNFEEKYQAVIAYKEKIESNKNNYKVMGFYYSDWMKEEELSIKIRGLDLDAVYENLLRDIGNERLNINLEESIQEAFERDEKIKELEKQLKKLESKKAKEIQLNKQMKINDEIKRLKKELENLK